MAPPKLDLVARTVETDPAFMLLYFALKHPEEGKINFLEVPNSMGLDTANAAKKRYARLIKVQDEGASSDTGQNGNPKRKAAPKKGRGPQKKQRVAKAKNVAMNVAWKKEDQDDEEDDSDKNAAEIKSESAVNEENTRGASGRR